MTANITIPVQKVSNVLKVPSAALRFTPPFAMGGKHPSGVSPTQAVIREIPAPRQALAVVSLVRVRGPGIIIRPERIPHRHPPLQVNCRVFILDKDKIHFVPVQVGLTASGYTQVTGNLTEGQLVVVGIINQQSTGMPAAGPGAAPNPMMGMPRRF